MQRVSDPQREGKWKNRENKDNGGKNEKVKCKNRTGEDVYMKEVRKKERKE